MEVSSLEASSKRKSSELYYLDKKIHEQEVLQEAADFLPKTLANDNDTVVQGADSGVVNAACSMWCSSDSLFTSINRFQVLQSNPGAQADTYRKIQNASLKCQMTGNEIGNAVLSTRKKNRERTLMKNLQK